MAVYTGARFQKGHGLGSVFGSVLRAALPTLKTAGKKVLKTGLETGVGIATDALKGKNIKTAARQRVTQAATKALLASIKATPNRRPPQKRKRPAKRRPAKQTKRRRTAKDIFD